MHLSLKVSSSAQIVGAWLMAVVPEAVLLTLGAHAQRGLQYLVCHSVCLSVCLSADAILAVCATKGITKDTIVLSVKICGNIKMAFFLKLSYSKVRASFTYLGRGGHL